MPCPFCRRPVVRDLAVLVNAVAHARCVEDQNLLRAGRVRTRVGAPRAAVATTAVRKPMLHEVLLANRAAIIARARAKTTARPAPRAIEEALGSGIPLFLDQLIDALRLLQASTPAMEESATRHGGDLVRRGFTVA